jgi:hypothetical protein
MLPAIQNNRGEIEGANEAWPATAARSRKLRACPLCALRCLPPALHNQPPLLYLGGWRMPLCRCSATEKKRLASLQR